MKHELSGSLAGVGGSEGVGDAGMLNNSGGPEKMIVLETTTIYRAFSESGGCFYRISGLTQRTSQGLRI